MYSTADHGNPTENMSLSTQIHRWWKATLPIWVVFFYMGAIVYLQPSFMDGKFVEQNSQKQAFTVPLETHQINGVLHGSMIMRTRVWHANAYRILYYHCLSYLRVNQATVPLEPCNSDKHMLVELGKYIHYGNNHIEFVLQNGGRYAMLHINPSFTDLKVLLTHVLFLSIFLLSITPYIRRYAKSIHPYTWYVLIAATILRFTYVLSTPYTVRGYDEAQHFEYLLYVLENWKIPPLHLHWQSYQPPLYYFFTAGVLAPITLLGANNTTIAYGAQLIALLLSIVSLGLVAWIAQLLFRKKEELYQRVLFVAIIACLPGVVFLSARISNDVLLPPLWLCSFAFLLRWWQKGNGRDWYVAVLLCSLGILTKLNGLLFLPVLGITLLAKEKTELRQLARYTLWSAALFLLVTGWYFVLRFLVEHQTHLIGNIGTNNPALFSQDWSLWHLIAIKPFAMIQYPFNHTWTDTYGRNYFWLYMPKSVFTGEWNFGDAVNRLLRPVLLLNMALLTGAIWYMLKDMVWKSNNVPLWSTILSLILGSWLLQAQKHNGGLQDFRYLTLLVIPVTYYVLQPLNHKNAGVRFLWIAFCTVFLILLLATNIFIMKS